MLLYFEIIMILLGLMVNNSALGIVIFLPARLPRIIMCNCVAPSCNLILELIGVYYNNLFLFSEIQCSGSIHFVMGKTWLDKLTPK